MTTVLVSCPPMLAQMAELEEDFRAASLIPVTVAVTQTLSEEELLDLVPNHDGWIIGDDPATEDVLRAGVDGRLRAALKWGIGVDNVDQGACRMLGIPFDNTPGMFGREVADLALGYVIGLARETFVIDRGVRKGEWPKPAGISLAGRRAGVIGFGDIGRNIVTRLLASEMHVSVFDPFARDEDIPEGVQLAEFSEGVGSLDFLVVACALTNSSFHMVGADALARAKPGLRVVNVSRGPVIDEAALCASLDSGHVHSAALDVFEQEPLPADSRLRHHDRCIFGSHNASNTVDAVLRTSRIAIAKIEAMLNAGPT